MAKLLEKRISKVSLKQGEKFTVGKVAMNEKGVAASDVALPLLQSKTFGPLQPNPWSIEDAYQLGNWYVTVIKGRSGLFASTSLYHRSTGWRTVPPRGIPINLEFLSGPRGPVVVTWRLMRSPAILCGSTWRFFSHEATQIHPDPKIYDAIQFVRVLITGHPIRKC